MIAGNNPSGRFFYSLLILSVLVHLAGYLLWSLYFKDDIKEEQIIQVELLLEEQPKPKYQAKQKNKRSKQSAKKNKQTSPKKHEEVSPASIATNKSTVPIKVGKSIQSAELFSTVRQPDPDHHGLKPVENAQNKTFTGGRPTEDSVSVQRSSVDITDSETTHSENNGYSAQLRRKGIEGTVLVEKSKTEDKKADIRRINGESGLFGEILNRKVIFKPALPQISLDETVKIRLQFSVSPSGEVVEVIPELRASKYFEEIAVQYVRKYRFEPINGNINQTGAIELILKR